MVMCHMVADTIEELHEMATALGVRKWFQDKPNKPHYDICLQRKMQAIKLGAKEVTSKELLNVLKGYRVVNQ